MKKRRKLKKWVIKKFAYLKNNLRFLAINFSYEGLGKIS